jgi:hypothetical protein
VAHLGQEVDGEAELVGRGPQARDEALERARACKDRLREARVARASEPRAELRKRRDLLLPCPHPVHAAMPLLDMACCGKGYDGDHGGV